MLPEDSHSISMKIRRQHHYLDSMPTLIAYDIDQHCSLRPCHYRIPPSGVLEVPLLTNTAENLTRITHHVINMKPSCLSSCK